MRISRLSAVVFLALSSASVCVALVPGPDLAVSWQRAELVPPAPKPNQRTTIEGIFTLSNVGDQTAPASRVAVYLRPDRPRINVRDASVSRLLRTLDVPALLPGQQWHGRVAVGLEPGLDAAGLRLTAVANSSGTVADSSRANNEGASAVIAPLPTD